MYLPYLVELCNYTRAIQVYQKFKIHVPSKISLCNYHKIRGARRLSGRVSDSGARGPGFETYRIGDQRRFSRACAYAQSHQSLHWSHTWGMEVDEGSTTNQTSSPAGWLRMHIWRMGLWRTKSATISWAGSIFLQKVDGFISPDSDFFCYGGHTLIRDVYKEYKVSQKSHVLGQIGLCKQYRPSSGAPEGEIWLESTLFTMCILLRRLPWPSG